MSSVLCTNVSGSAFSCCLIINSQVSIICWDVTCKSSQCLLTWVKNPKWGRKLIRWKKIVQKFKQKNYLFHLKAYEISLKCTHTFANIYKHTIQCSYCISISLKFYLPVWYFINLSFLKFDTFYVCWKCYLIN